MPASISLLVAYPKEVIRAGLRVMLERSSIKIVAETNEVTSALSLAKKYGPDVVLLDAFSTAGRGYKAVVRIRKINPGTKFLFLTALENPTYLARAKAVGASNVLLEGLATKEFITAIENAAAGKPAKPTEPFAKIGEALTGKPNAITKQVKLTPRELQVLAHVAFGLINDEIAASLGIGDATVKEHVLSILRKLKVVDRTQAALWAVQNGVV
jgi:DNA-binding NarL/FixJ family response regulator